MSKTPADVAMGKVTLKNVNSKSFMIKAGVGYELQFFVDDNGETVSFTWNKCDIDAISCKTPTEEQYASEECGYCCQCNCPVWSWQDGMGKVKDTGFYIHVTPDCGKLEHEQHNQCIICVRCYGSWNEDNAQWDWVTVELKDCEIDIPFIKRLQKELEKEMEEKLKKGFCAECEKELSDDELIYIYKIEEDGDECILCQDCNQEVVHPNWKEISLSDCSLQGEYIAKKKLQASSTVVVDPNAEIAI